MLRCRFTDSAETHTHTHMVRDRQTDWCLWVFFFFFFLSPRSLNPLRLGKQEVNQCKCDGFCLVCQPLWHTSYIFLPQRNLSPELFRLSSRQGKWRPIGLARRRQRTSTKTLPTLPPPHPIIITLHPLLSFSLPLSTLLFLRAQGKNDRIRRENFCGPVSYTHLTLPTTAEV